jgi:hypothetical protein
METYILKENVLTDDLLMIPSKNEVFKGKYIAIIKQYDFLNSWNDKLTVKKFRSEKMS